MTRAVTPTNGTAHLSWPCERFYWSLLDVSVLPAGERPTQDRLRYLLEADLPEPLEDVHAAFARADAKTWLACALPTCILRSEVPPGAVTLAPSALPEFVQKAVGTRLDAGSLNVLVGEFEPRPVHAARRRCTTIGAAAVALTFALAVVGVERRTSQAHADAARLRAIRDDRVAAALGPTPTGQALPPELRLAAELRALRQTRRQSEQVVVAPDATDALVDLLRLWPRDLPTRTDAVVVSESSVHVRGTVPESEQAQQLASATQSLRGHDAGFPSVQSGPDGWRFALEWRRSSGAKR